MLSPGCHNLVYFEFLPASGSNAVSDSSHSNAYLFQSLCAIESSSSCCSLRSSCLIGTAAILQVVRADLRLVATIEWKGSELPQLEWSALARLLNKPRTAWHGPAQLSVAALHTCILSYSVTKSQ